MNSDDPPTTDANGLVSAVPSSNSNAPPSISSPTSCLATTSNPTALVTSTSNLRLSIRIPRAFSATVSFSEGDLMSPRTMSDLHKEVPRAALRHPRAESEEPSMEYSFVAEEAAAETSDGYDDDGDEDDEEEFISTATVCTDSTADALSEEHDSSASSSKAACSSGSGSDEDAAIQGLEALAASATARGYLLVTPSPPPAFPSPLQISSKRLEEDVLGKLFTNDSFEAVGGLGELYSEHCSLKESGMQCYLSVLADAELFLNERGLALSLKTIFPLTLSRLVEQESSRLQRRKDFTGLLTNSGFLRGIASVLLVLPAGLVGVFYELQEVVRAMQSSLFDWLSAVELVLRALPELLTLRECQGRLKSHQQRILEDLIWNEDSVDGDEEEGKNTSLMRSIVSEMNPEGNASRLLFLLSNGIRSPQKALETLTGFSGCGPSGPAPAAPKVSPLELFFRKFLRLGSQRIQMVCNRLGLPPLICQRSWEFFVELVQNEGCPNQIPFFHRRHLNQLLLAIIYTISKLFDNERTLQQISSVLGNGSSTEWIQRVVRDSRDLKGGHCDFYTFYNEVFLPPLQNRLKRLLISQQGSDGVGGDDWVLSRLFSCTPLPPPPIHHLNPHVSLEMMNNDGRSTGRGNSSAGVSFEIIDPASSSSSTDHTAPASPSQMLCTPSPTFLSLLKSTATATTTATDDRRKRPPSPSADSSRFGKIARRLDFSD